jgi:hypothetical protein
VRCSKPLNARRTLANRTGSSRGLARLANATRPFPGRSAHASRNTGCRRPRTRRPSRAQTLPSSCADLRLEKKRPRPNKRTGWVPTTWAPPVCLSTLTHLIRHSYNIISLAAEAGVNHTFCQAQRARTSPGRGRETPARGSRRRYRRPRAAVACVSVSESSPRATTRPLPRLRLGMSRPVRGPRRIRWPSRA